MQVKKVDKHGLHLDYVPSSLTFNILYYEKIFVKALKTQNNGVRIFVCIELASPT